MTDKRNIFLVGPMSSGKSTIGRQLAKKLNMDFFDSDQEIENNAGVDISWIFDIEGEKKFSQREEKIINDLTKKKCIVLSTGSNSIKSSKIRNYLSTRGIVIYLKTTVQQQFMRIQFNKKRNLLIKSKVFSYKILETLDFERNSLYENISDIIIHTNEKNIRIITTKIINLLT